MISWRPDKETKYALCASETEILLAGVGGGNNGAYSVRKISSALRDHGDEIAVNRLFAGTGKKKAKIALVLPLSSFEIVSVTVPAVNREAVARLLPYNLSKILDTPVTDYIYDWQVVQTFSERQELTVYLYPVAMFKKFQQDLQGHQKEIAWFEADVFAACSYLERCGLTPGDGAILCVLIWQGSISMAVYEQERITLVRSVDLRSPAEPYHNNDGSSGGPAVVQQDAGQVVIEPGEILSGPEGGQEMLKVEAFDQVETENLSDGNSNFADNQDILAEFCLLSENQGVPALTITPESVALAEKGGGGQRGQQEWQGYLQSINLEIMRTNDYHVSVLKGKPVNRVFVGGAEPFYSALEQAIKETIGVQVELFPPQKVDADCVQNLAALCIGALRR